MPENNYVILV